MSVEDKKPLVRRDKKPLVCRDTPHVAQFPKEVAAMPRDKAAEYAGGAPLGSPNPPLPSATSGDLMPPPPPPKKHAATTDLMPPPPMPSRKKQEPAENKEGGDKDILPPPPPPAKKNAGEGGFVAPGPVKKKGDAGHFMPPPPPKKAASVDVEMMPPPPAKEAQAAEEEDKEHTDEKEKTATGAQPHPQQPARPTSKPAGATAVPELPYEEPEWSAEATIAYGFEVIKGGIVVESVPLSGKSFFSIGRLPTCDIPMEHPSISRYHAVIQHRDNGGVYVYDLGSTHGTQLNKTALQPRTYYRMKIGHSVQLGQSTRLMMLVGPEEQAQAEEEELVAAQRQKLLEALKKKEGAGAQDQQGDDFCAWGFSEDAKEEEAEEEDAGLRDGALARASLMNLAPDDDDRKEKRWMRDPKRALASFFEHEGMELDYKVEQDGPGHARIYKCRIQLPIDAGGDWLFAEAVSARRKDAEKEAALDACKKLEAHGLFGAKRKAGADSLSVRKPGGGDSSSDDDDYLDRTGQATKKKERRKLRAQRQAEQADPSNQQVETADSLKEKILSIDAEMEGVHESIDEWNKNQGRAHGAGGEDDLDSFMEGLNTNLSKEGLKQLKNTLTQLEKDRERTLRLLKYADPKFDPATLHAPKQAPAKEKSPPAKPPAPVPVATIKPPAHTPKEEKKEIKAPAPTEPNGAATASMLPPPPRPKPKTTPAAPPTSTPMEEENPPASDQPAPQDETEEAGDEKKRGDRGQKRKGAGGADKPAKRSHGAMSHMQALQQADEDWAPPADQSGDGRTALNDKFGY